MNNSVGAEPEYRLIKQKAPHERYSSETTIQELLKSRLSKKRVNNKMMFENQKQNGFIDGMVSQSNSFNSNPMLTTSKNPLQMRSLVVESVNNQIPLNQDLMQNYRRKPEAGN